MLHVQTLGDRPKYYLFCVEHATDCIVTFSRFLPGPRFPLLSASQPSPPPCAVDYRVAHAVKYFITHPREEQMKNTIRIESEGCGKRMGRGKGGKGGEVYIDLRNPLHFPFFGTCLHPLVPPLAIRGMHACPILKSQTSKGDRSGLACVHHRRLNRHPVCCHIEYQYSERGTRRDRTLRRPPKQHTQRKPSGRVSSSAFQTATHDIASKLDETC